MSVSNNLDKNLLTSPNLSTFINKKLKFLTFLSPQQKSFFTKIATHMNSETNINKLTKYLIEIDDNPEDIDDYLSMYMDDLPEQSNPISNFSTPHDILRFYRNKESNNKYRLFCISDHLIWTVPTTDFQTFIEQFTDIITNFKDDKIDWKNNVIFVPTNINFFHLNKSEIAKLITDYNILTHSPDIYTSIEDKNGKVINKYEPQPKQPISQNLLSDSELEELNDKFMIATSGLHSDVATVFINDYKDDIIIDKKDTGYIWNKNTKLWEYCEEMGKKFFSIIFDWQKNILDIIPFLQNKAKHMSPENPEQNKIISLIIKYERLIKALKTTGFNKSLIIPISSRLPSNNNIPFNQKYKHCLPIRNGNLLNFKTLEVRERLKDDFYTFECDVDFIDDPDNIGRKFHLDLCCGDEQYESTLQQLCGYFLTGENNLKLIPIITGSGNNGKTVFGDTFELSLGDKYYSPLPESVAFIQKSKSTLDVQLSCLQGVRFSFFGDTPPNSVLNMGNLKAISGSDSLKLRNSITSMQNIKFDTKIAVACNELPSFTFETAVFNRVRALPFNNIFPVDDAKKQDILHTYRDHIFSYRVIGAYKYYLNNQKLDLLSCNAIQKATTNLINQKNPLNTFIIEKILTPDLFFQQLLETEVDNAEKEKRSIKNVISDYLDTIPDERDKCFENHTFTFEKCQSNRMLSKTTWKISREDAWKSYELYSRGAGYRLNRNDFYKTLERSFTLSQTRGVYYFFGCKLNESCDFI